MLVRKPFVILYELCRQNKPVYIRELAKILSNYGWDVVEPNLRRIIIEFEELGLVKTEKNGRKRMIRLNIDETQRKRILKIGKMLGVDNGYKTC